MLNIEMVRGDTCLDAHRDMTDWISDGAHYTDAAAAQLAVDFYKVGCDRATIYLEDVILVLPPVPQWAIYGRQVVTFDIITGTTHHVWLQSDQIEALLMLSIGGVDDPEYYDLLQLELEGWPSCCSPVP